MSCIIDCFEFFPLCGMDFEFVWDLGFLYWDLT